MNLSSNEGDKQLQNKLTSSNRKYTKKTNKKDVGIIMSACRWESKEEKVNIRAYLFVILLVLHEIMDRRCLFYLD